jgi:protein disulfide-isomerase A1
MKPKKTSYQLMPRFAEAAATLRAMGSVVAFTKLDGEHYPKAAPAIGVKGFPTILLFVNGTEHAYHGLHTK